MPSKFVDFSQLGTLENVRVAKSAARSGIMRA